MGISSLKILVITPIMHIDGVAQTLESIGEVTYMDDPLQQDILKSIQDFDAIFTNPNKSKIFIGKEVIDAAKNLKVICTASTGTNHIDKLYAEKVGVKIIALTEEREILKSISSTAEMAFALTMSGLRNVVCSHESVMRGEWDYTKFIGRQMSSLTVGVIGYGRLGSMYSKYCLAFGSRVLVFDPYQTIHAEELEQIQDLEILLQQSDIISLHVHVSKETQKMINANTLCQMKEDVLLVNTSRGEIVNEKDLVNFLKTKPNAKVATDVLTDEIRNRTLSPLFLYSQKSHQVTITPHIGGMSREAQEIAYGHASNLLNKFLTKENIND